MTVLSPPEPLFAQRQSVSIEAIRVEGNVTADEEIIKLNAGLEAGMKVGGEDIQRAIKQLWNLGIYSDIQFIAEKQEGDKIWLLVQVVEYPRIMEIRYIGNKEIKKKEFDKQVKLNPGQRYRPFLITNALKAVKKIYEEEGYRRAVAESKIIDVDSVSQKIVEFHIDEGAKVQVKKIRFTDNTIFDDKRLRKQMKETKEDTWWRGADFKPDQYEEDKEKVIEYYQKEGFRNARIVKDSVYYGDHPGDLFIDITIEEGSQYYFGFVTFDGNAKYSDQELLAMVTFQPGARYNLDKYTKSRENINTLYSDNGHLFVNVIPQEVDAGEDTVDIKYNIYEGNAVKIREVVIKGNTKTKEKVIRREITMHPGDIFLQTEIQRSMREVWMLNYFANVVPAPQMIPGDEEFVNLEMRVEEKSTDTANLSAGYSQRDGLIGAIGVTMNNFFGNGQQVSLDWQFGRIFRSFSISLTEPWLFDTPTLAGISLFDTKRGGEFYGFDWRNRGASFRLGRRFKWPDDYFMGTWIFSLSRNSISNIRNDLQLEAFLIGQTSSAISLTQIIQRDSRDQPEFPSKGSVVAYSLQYSGGVLGGSEDFLKHTVSLDRYIPIINRVALFDNATFGYLTKLKSDSYIPPLDLFYMGGTGLTIGTPLRGYDERSVGPLTSSGIAIGAKVQTKFTTELRVLIVLNPMVFGHVFAEAGNVWETIGATNPFDLRRSVGIGGRVFMPLVGKLGIDFGYGFDNFDPVTGERRGEWHTHFSFGQNF